MSAEASSRAVSPICSGRAAVRALGVNRGAGRRLDLGRRRRMIAMGMGDENVGYGFAAHRIEQRGNMGVVLRTGIDDRDLAAADDVAHRALEGERARIIGDDGAHAGRHVGGAAGHQIECLVVSDVVAHSPDFTDAPAGREGRWPPCAKELGKAQ